VSTASIASQSGSFTCEAGTVRAGNSGSQVEKNDLAENAETRRSEQKNRSALEIGSDKLPRERHTQLESIPSLAMRGRVREGADRVSEEARLRHFFLLPSPFRSP